MTAEQHLPDDQAAPDLVQCTIVEASRLLAIDEPTVRERIASGALMAMSVDGDWKVLLPRHLLQQPAPAADTPGPRAAAPSATRSPALVIAKGVPVKPAVGPRIRRDILIGLVVLSAVSTGYVLAWFGSAWLARDTRSMPAAVVMPAPAAAEDVGAESAAPPTAVAANAGSQPSSAATAAPEGMAEQGSAAPPQQAGAVGGAPQTISAAASADELMQRLAQAEADVRSGWLEAVLDFGSSSSTADIRFDVERADEPRLQISTTYISGDQIQRIEQIVIGNQVWERQGTGEWQPIAGLEGVWSQVQTFMPRAQGSTRPAMQAGDTDVELRWHNPDRDTDVTVRVDPVSGQPHEMRQMLRGADTELRVVYRGWNTPVAITPP